MPHVYSPTLSALTHLLSRLSLLFLSTGLMITSAVLYHVLHFFHITIDIRNVCVFLAPLFSSFTAIVTYHFTKELKVKHMLCTCKVSHYKSCSSRWGVDVVAWRVLAVKCLFWWDPMLALDVGLVCFPTMACLWHMLWQLICRPYNCRQ